MSRGHQSEPVPGQFRLSAACPSARRVCVVTLNWTGSAVTLAPAASTFVELERTDQVGMKQACRSLFDFLEKSAIDQLVVRRLNSGSERAGSVDATRFETMLLLMPIDCYVVTSQRITPWVHSAPWHLPLPQKRLDPERRRLQLRAIQTGAYVMARLLERRDFPSTETEP